MSKTCGIVVKLLLNEERCLHHVQFSSSVIGCQYRDLDSGRGLQLLDSSSAGKTCLMCFLVSNIPRPEFQ